MYHSTFYMVKYHFIRLFVMALVTALSVASLLIMFILFN